MSDQDDASHHSQNARSKSAISRRNVLLGTTSAIAAAVTASAMLRHDTGPVFRRGTSGA